MLFLLFSSFLQYLLYPLVLLLREASEGSIFGIHKPSSFYLLNKNSEQFQNATILHFHETADMLE